MRRGRFIFLSSVAVSLFLYGCSTIRPTGSLRGLTGVTDGEGSKIVTFHAVGKGLSPETAINKGQAILMAEKAAVADGYKKLIEKIRGVYVDAYMQSGQGMVDHDIIRTHTQSWLRGAEIMGVKQADNGITEAYMALRVNFAHKNMIWWPTGISGLSSRSSSAPGMYSSVEP